MLYQHTDLNVHDFVSFINNGRTQKLRLVKTQKLRLDQPLLEARISTALSKLCNSACKILPATGFPILSSFK